MKQKDYITPRFPHLIHGGDYNPDQWLDRPDILERDIELMKRSGCNAMSVAIFAWAALEPEEGVYNFEWLDDVIGRMYDNGIYTILATPSGARPRWMSEKYPEVSRVSQTLHRELHRGRHNHCYSSPVYREKVKQMNTKLAERYASNPAVILWHLSNEYGGDCHCPLCENNWREWLKKKYGTVENLNKAWWLSFWSQSYQSWDQIHLGSAFMEEGRRAHLNYPEWQRFVSDMTADFCKWEADAVKAVNPDIPVTANLMLYFNQLNYYRLSESIDVASWDAYPWWHSGDDNTEIAINIGFYHNYIRCLKHRPFMLMESTPSMTNWQPVSKLKRPGMHMLSSMQAVAHGSDSVQYFQWRKSRGSFEQFHGAVVDHYGGSDTRVFRDVAEVGKRLGAWDELCGTTVKSDVCILYDIENQWAIESSAGPRNCGVGYHRALMDMYRPFWQMGVNVDTASEEYDFSGYKLVVAPMLFMIRPGFADKIKAFVKNGGTFVATYWTGIVGETCLAFLGGFPGELGDVLGIWSEEIDALYDGQTNTVVPATGLLTRSYTASELCDLIHAKTAKVLATYGDDFYAGRPALTVNEYGDGKAYYIASRNDADFHLDFFKHVVEEAGIQRNLDTALPHGVTVTTRTDGDTTYRFVQNFNGYPVTIALPQAYTVLDDGSTVQGDLQLDGYSMVVLR